MLSDSYLPKVSVIIPNYNYRNYLEEAIESVLFQSYPNIEIICVDDGSKDGSLDFLLFLQKKHPSLKVFTHKGKVNKGLPASLKLGVEHSSGEWLAFLEADDVWDKQCIEKRVQAVQQAEVGFCLNNIFPIFEDKDRRGWYEAYVPRVMRKLQHVQGASGKFKVDRLILQENLVPTFSCAMVKKEVISSCDFNTPVAAWLDWFLWIQVLQRTHGTLITEKLTKWRIHNASQNSKKSLKKFLNDYSFFRKMAGERLASMNCEDRDRKISLLRKPTILVLVQRFFINAREVGFVYFFKQVVKRFLN